MEMTYETPIILTDGMNDKVPNQHTGYFFEHCGGVCSKPVVLAEDEIR